MFKEAFEKLELEDVATILDRVNPHVHGMQFDPVETTIMAINIPFYPGCRLLDIADYSSVPASRRYVVYAADKAVVLDFTNAPIYALNRELPVRLDEDNVADYVRFFFSFVRTPRGKFIICENVDDIRWKDDPPPQARKAIGRMIQPILLKPGAAEGAFALQATMTFKDSLFKSDITVKADGTVSLHDQELLVEAMPVLDDAFEQ